MREFAVLSTIILLNGSPLVTGMNWKKSDKYDTLPSKIQGEVSSTDSTITEEYCRSPPLHIAVAFVRNLVEGGADLDALNCDGLTPVQLAGEGELFQSLFAGRKKKGHIAEQKECRNSELHHGVAAILALLDKGADPGQPDCQGATPMIVASLQYNVQVVLEQVCRTTPLHVAIKNRIIWAVRYILEKGSDMYALDCENLTPMDVAVLANDLEMIKVLAWHRYDLNRIGVHRNTVLHMAAAKSNVLTVETLLDLGSHVDSVDEEGGTPLLEALMAKRLRIVQVLLKRGAQVNLRLNNGDTYVHKLSEMGNVDGLIILRHMNLLNPLLLNSLNNMEETALLKGVKEKMGGVVSLLLTLGANASFVGADGRTLVHTAVESGCITCLSMLLEAGLEADRKDASGVPPSLLAVRRDDEVSLELLAEHGASLERQLESGRTLLEEATRLGSVAVLRWLLHTQWLRPPPTTTAVVPPLRYFTLSSGRVVYIR